MKNFFLFLKNDVIKNYIYSLKAKKRLLIKDTPILIYQPGKVGSMSIYKSLKKYKKNVFHTHFLNHNHKSLEIRTFYNEFVLKKRKVKIITLIRNPFKRNESSFFELKNMFINKKKYTTNQIRKIYINDFPHFDIINWFENELFRSTGIDVYKKKLIDDMYQKYKMNNFEVLLLKCEISNKHKEKIICDFLKLNKFKINNTNRSKDKSYSKLYSDFKESIKYPDFITKKIKNSIYYKSFYN